MPLIYNLPSMPSYVTNAGLSDRINSYLAVLVITIFGAFMALVIIHVINLNTVYIVSADDTVLYTYQ